MVISLAPSTTSSAAAPVPKNLFGYDVVSVVGHGAGSTIYAVTNPAGQLFAMKHVVKKTDKDERYLEQLVNEQEMSRLFRHPALRKAIELKTPRKFFSNKFSEAGLVLEWVNGLPLSENVPADMPTVLEIFAHCAAALGSIHKLRLVHCDFKPSNVLICDDGKIKVIDFGQTCKVQTAKQRMQGTPDFIAPEQYKCVAVDEKTDVYCFGASLYWVLTGTKVPTYATVDRADRDIIKLQKFPTPMELKPRIPEAVSKFIMHCLMYNPDRRVPNMMDVLKELEAFIHPPEPATPTAAVPHAPVHKPRRVTDWGI